MFAKLKQFRETNSEEKEVRVNYHSAVKVLIYAIIKNSQEEER